jgi:hypothetical protein
MNPYHADESDQRDDMPRAVEHALRKHNALDDELCRTVAGEVWQDMQQAYDDLYEMWFRQTCRESETNEEIWRLRAEVSALQHQVNAFYLSNPQAGVVQRMEMERDNLRDALEKIASSNGTSTGAIMLAEIARDALEGKP